MDVIHAYISTAPAAEPILLADAKLHLRAEGTADDATITRHIKVARRQVEAYTNRALITQTWVSKLNAFPGSDSDRLVMPKPPLQSVTTLKYYDTSGDQQTWDSDEYTVVISEEPGYIIPAYGYAWPSTRDQVEAVEITWKAGYGAAGTNVPDDIVQAMYMLIGHWYENREEVVIGTITSDIRLGYQSLLGPHRMGRHR